QLFSSYGPSECSVITVLYPLAHLKPNSKTIPLGSLLSNTQAEVVDENLSLVPINAVGELLLSGDCVGKGYYLNELATQAAFIEKQGKRFYKTGDLVYWGEDGLLHFVGRKDDQLKIRGQKV